MDINYLLPDLFRRAANQRNEAILFHFSFGTIQVKGVFFARSKTITIGIKERNVGWQIDLSSGALSNFIPHDAYTQISPHLKCKEGKYSNHEFFLKLQSVLAELSASTEHLCPTDDEIRELIRSCKTTDKKHDSEGDKPFFDHWRRVSPSNESKKKIQHYFGVDVKKACCKNNVTAVWSAEPTANSLLFLHPPQAKREIESVN